MDKDEEKLLNIGKKGAAEVLTKQLSFTLLDSNKFMERQFRGQNAISYEKFVEKALEVYMCELVPNKIVFPLNKERFISEFLGSIFFIKAQPFYISLGEIFEKLGKETLDKKDYESIMKGMFAESHPWIRKTGEYR